ncbi:LOW QUALITY PROTEIN: salivary peroxidase/catechol oxidase-like [Panulirus ornatus]|uniref:LOW QUALITY PROTEIN: salivary peroxidase/catechol oxidase-like n=1 Tax=Panulirus ornatus TaxID=150431 RepID=UPI003A8ADA19
MIHQVSHWGNHDSSSQVALLVALATGLSVLIRDGIRANEDPQVDPVPDNQSLITLMSLPWPRRDQEWYVRRWERSRTMTPDDPHKRQFEDDPENPDDPDGPEWTTHDRSTFPDNDTWNWNRRPSDLPDWTGDDVSESLSYGSMEEKEKTKVEEELAKRNLSLVRGSPSYKHQQAFRKTDPQATKMAKLGYMMGHATTKMKDRINLTRETATFDSQWVGDMSASPYCDKGLLRPHPGPCNSLSRYRSVDGTCNNLKNPTWGASFTPFRRALPPDYGDGVSSVRRAADGGDLPSARLVSTTVHLNKLADSRSYTVLTMTWGQFVDHDITLTALSKGSGGRSIPCCSEEILLQPSLYHPECNPIMIPKDDPFYAAFNQTCMEFTRSAPAPRCNFGPREQLNQQTAFLDGSIIYGTSEKQLASLRKHQDGLLQSQVTLDGRELLPASQDPDDGCNVEDQTHYDRFCFTSGDSRVNEQILLTVMHTVWARQHNLLALELKDLNPDWDDERLFQEARKILIAQIQHITYNEYVPSIIGPNFMKHLKLSPQVERDEPSHDYDEMIHPGIANEFAAAAYRFGHSQIQGLIQKIDGPGMNIEFAQLNTFLFNPYSLYDPGNMANLVRGEGAPATPAFGYIFSPQVTGRLFRGDSPFGLDLVSMNIQRGRDHGVGGYNRWRMYCGLPPASNFSDLARDMDAGALNSITKVYRSISPFCDYSPFDPSPGHLEFSMTFKMPSNRTLLNLLQTSVFPFLSQSPSEQLAEIHKSSLARVLCDNVPEMGSIQRWPLRKYATGNPRLPCSSMSIPRVDLGAWEEGDL